MGASGTLRLLVFSWKGFLMVYLDQRTLRKLVPNIPLQALVRGANGVGYTSYPCVFFYSRRS